MLNNSKMLIFVMVMAVTAVLCGICPAADSNSTPTPVPVLTTNYVVASPRACLIGQPRSDPNHFVTVLGDAENFPRENGEIKVPLGSRVVFLFSRQLEGVWYDHSFGRIDFSMVLQRRLLIPDPNIPILDSNDVNSPEWVDIGHDFASDLRRGPTIGQARVGVPVFFRWPGIYLLRAKITTVAQPMFLPPTADSNTEPLLLPPAVDSDIVYVTVKVVNLPRTQINPDVEPPIDPDVNYTNPMPTENTPDEQGILDGDFNSDGTVNLLDFAIMAQQWGIVQQWGTDADLPEPLD